MSGVMLPDIGAVPTPYSPSALLISVAALAALSIVAFVWVVLTSGRLQARGLPMLRIAGVALVAMLVSVGLSVLIGTHDEAAHERMEHAYWDHRNAAGAQLVADLETHYGIVVLEPSAVSLNGFRNPVDVDRGTGPEECWVGTVNEVVEIRCDGADWDSATPLEPAFPGWMRRVLSGRPQVAATAGRQVAYRVYDAMAAGSTCWSRVGVARQDARSMRNAALGVTGNVKDLAELVTPDPAPAAERLGL